MSQQSYYTAYSLLIKDFLKLCEYVEPADVNERVYSHRLYELYLRACTEFENVCKEILIGSGYQKSGNFKISDYRTLDASLKLSQREVGLLFWQPTEKYISPFKDWQIMGAPLSWYQSYNEVKHNRNAEFSKASLENAVKAVAGLFLLLFSRFGLEFFNPYAALNSSRKSYDQNDIVTITVNNSIFSVRFHENV